MLLKNKVAVITGSSSNIGKSVAFRFGREGAKIVVNNRSHIKEGEAVAKSLRELGVEAIYVQADVSEENEANRLINATIEKFGTIDILVNNAGKATGIPFLEMTKDNLIDQFNNNF